MVSILIPIYNSAPYLSICLDSVVNQIYQDIQVVLIDDGSTDNSLTICQEYAKKYPFIEVYHQENAGVSVARNNLLSKIKGDFFLFVDSDDWMELNMVAFLVDKAESSGADIVTCGMVKDDIPVVNDFIEEIYYHDDGIKQFLDLLKIQGTLWNKLFKTKLIQDIRFCESIIYGEDLLFCWEMFKRQSKIVYTTKQLYHYKTNNTASISHGGIRVKYMAYQVWQHICNDAVKMSPEIGEIAKGAFALAMLFIITGAFLISYPKDEIIVEMQKIVRKYKKYAIKHQIRSPKVLLYYLIFGYFYKPIKCINRRGS